MPILIQSYEGKKVIDMNQYNQFQQSPFMQQQCNGVNWVSGFDGARSWQLAPNSNAIMLDRENDGIFYIKASGYDAASIIEEQESLLKMYSKKINKCFKKA